jgi:hypothetical protein
MFWNWVSAAERRELSLRAERVTDAIRVALENRTLDRAPQPLVDDVLASMRQLAAVAPRDLSSAVARAEQQLEQLRPYLGAAPDGGFDR